MDTQKFVAPLPSLNLRALLAGTLAMLALALPAPAQTWNVPSGDWNVPGNWSPSGVPGSHDVASIDNGGTASISAGTTGESESLLIGNAATGFLDVSGSVDAYSWIVIGNFAGSNGTVTINPGGGLGAPRLDIGIAGTGTLFVNGGNVGVGDASIGNGSATLTGGATWSASSIFIGPGSLHINDGTVTSISATVDNGGSVTVASGTCAVNYAMFSKVENGTVNLTGKGVFFAGNGFTPEELESGTLVLGTSGTLNLGTSGSAGTLKAAAVAGESAACTVNFNHTGNYTFIPQLTGALSVRQIGPGTTVLAGSNSYTGATVVASGTLKLDIHGSIIDSSGVVLAPCGVFDTTALASGTFEMLGGQPFEFVLNPYGNGSAGLLDAAGLDITDALVSFVTLGTLDDPVYIIASYNSLEGAGFGCVKGLPCGYSIDYSYNGHQIALVQTVPEPGVLGLTGMGVASLVILLRRKHSYHLAEITGQMERGPTARNHTSLGRSAA